MAKEITKKESKAGENTFLVKAKEWVKANRMCLTAFFLPILFLLILYISRGVFPFGIQAYMRMDFYHQYAPFTKEFIRKIQEGQSLFFAFENGLGANYLAQYAYYLASPLNWLFFFVPRDYVVEAMNISMVLRGGISGLAFFMYISKRHERKTWFMVALSVCYALSAYYLAYSCNIMWMDCYALFPLVVMGVDEIVKGKSGKWYGIAMAICTVSNFYIAVIVGMCLLCYLPISICARKGITWRDIIKALLRFCGITVLYVMIAAVLMLPVYLALQITSKVSEPAPDEIKLYFNFFELIQRLFMNMDLVLNKVDHPNAYSSVMIFLALPVFIGNKKISWKEKLSTTLVFAFLLFSFQCNVLDYIWHGLHFPASFQARQSFFFIFLALIMIYRAYENRDGIGRIPVLVCVVLEVIYIAVSWMFAGSELDNMGMLVYPATILFLILYLVLWYSEKGKSVKTKKLLIVICILECFINMISTGINSTVIRHEYMERDAIMATILEDIEEKEEACGNVFYRIEEKDTKSQNDAAWNNYNGASYFSSTAPDGVRMFYKNFGLRYGVAAYSNKGMTPFTASFFGIKYYISDEISRPGSRYTKEVYIDDSQKLTVYANEQALPLGFMVDSDLENTFEIPQERNPYLVHNLLAQAVLSNEEEMFYPLRQEQLGVTQPLETYKDTPVKDGDVEQVRGETTSFVVPAGEPAYIFVKNATIVEVVIHDLDGNFQSRTIYDELDYRHSVPLYLEDFAREVQVTAYDEDGGMRVNMLSYAMKQEVLDKVYEELAKTPMVIEKMTDSHIFASVDAPKNGTVLTTIPYDSGWSVKIDGEKAEGHAWEDAFLSFEVPEGSHEIELQYVPPGFRLGLAISAVGIAISLFLLFRKKKA